MIGYQPKGDSIDNTRYIPGIMLSQTFPKVRDTVGASVATLSRAIASYPYRAVHSLDIVDSEERREFGALIRERELWLDFCLSRALGDQEISLSALNGEERLRAVDLVVEMIPRAVEQGARFVSFSSGSGHADEADRPAAIDRFRDSLESICRQVVAQTGRTLGLLIEPMDVVVHKRGSLGYLDESIAFAQAFERDVCEVRLICDTAHLRLNNESAIDFVSIAPELTAAVHLCNCCVDPEHELYGDHHIKPGPPGEFDLDDFRAILEQIAHVVEGASVEPPLPVFVEYRNHDDVGAHLAYLAEFWRLLDADI